MTTMLKFSKFYYSFIKRHEKIGYDRKNRQVNTDAYSIFNFEISTHLKNVQTDRPKLFTDNNNLLEACKKVDTERARALIESGADPAYFDPTDGVTCLMRASESGNLELMQLLLESGAPWNAQDKEGYTAGEYATASKNKGAMPLLLDWAVKSELLLSSLDAIQAERLASKEKGTDSNTKYLKQKLTYADGQLIDEDGEGVMMSWETPLMIQHADIICASGGDILNIGFGLGIIDTEIQLRKPRSHTIIEAHPDVYQHMLNEGWHTKPGVRIIFGKWQDVITTELEKGNSKFDGIFWDTYSEFYDDQREFQTLLPRLLRPGGVYSFFNGLAPDNLFFHLVYGEIARRELNSLGFSVQYQAVPIDASSSEIWEGVANRYWHLPVYFIPKCVYAKP